MLDSQILTDLIVNFVHVTVLEHQPRVPAYSMSKLMLFSSYRTSNNEGGSPMNMDNNHRTDTATYRVHYSTPEGYEGSNTYLSRESASDAAHTMVMEGCIVYRITRH